MNVLFTKRHKYGHSSSPFLRTVRQIVIASLFVALGRMSQAQIPRINTLFPIGGKAGTTVDVEVRGSSLDGANLLMVHGNGVTGVVEPGNGKVDETNKPLWQAKCQSCHELRSPANRSMTPGQWAATVERMVKVRQAPLSADEQAKVTEYLVGAARAGRVTAQLKVAPDTLPGLYELRIATPRGISTAGYFEVGNLPEFVGATGKLDQAQPIPLPAIANGCFMSNGEHHYFKFTAKKGQRLVFNMKAYRYNDMNQMYFNPNLRLYDAAGNELVENHGYYDFDPLIDWTCPNDGTYVIEARDLLGRANPGSVYRLVMGPVPYDTVLYPPGGQAGSTAHVSVVGKNDSGLKTDYALPVPSDLGIVQASSPYGPTPFFVSSFPVATDAAGAVTTPTMLPAGFAGRIAQPGASETFPIQGSGRFEFEGYATRLGAPTALRVTLLNANGQRIDSFDNDGRIAQNLEAGKAYALKIENTNGKGGPEFVYCIEARPVRGLDCVARPDNITLRPGVSTVVEVILTRREGITGDVQVSAEGLPPGVTATPAVIQPDRNEAWFLLSAAADAQPVEKPIKIVVSGHNQAGDVKIQATPQELYRLNNDLRSRNWSDAVVAVRGQADFTAEFLSPGPIKVHPRKGTEVKVKIKRRAGFTGNVTVFLSGLPQGWVANPESIGGDRDTVSLTVRPDGNDTRPFLNRDLKMTPIVATLEAQSDEFRFAFGTIPVAKADRISDRDDDR